MPPTRLLPIVAALAFSVAVPAPPINVRPILSPASSARAETARAWSATLLEARRAAEAGAHDRAETLLRDLLASGATTAPPPLLVARAHDDLAELYRETDRPERAIPHYEASVAGLERLLGERQPRVAVSLHNLGVCQGRAGLAAEARRTLDRAAALWEALEGPDSARLANTIRAIERYAPEPVKD